MQNVYKVKIENYSGVKFARSRALRECVFNTPNLRNEFYKIWDPSGTTEHEQFSEKVRKFISDKGLRILSEKPVARIKDDHYVVDVYFEVAW